MEKALLLRAVPGPVNTLKSPIGAFVQWAILTSKGCCILAWEQSAHKATLFIQRAQVTPKNLLINRGWDEGANWPPGFEKVASADCKAFSLAEIPEDITFKAPSQLSLLNGSVWGPFCA